MDDPWGSPWTAGEAERDEKPSPTPTPAGLEPPPRAVLTSNPTALPTFSAQLAWGDDGNGFGGWSTPDPAAGASAGWGGWAGGNGGDSSAASQQQLTPAPRYEGFGSTSPIAWPGSAAMANSPAFGPISRTSSVAHLRQPSPDPWACDFDPDCYAINRPAGPGDGALSDVSGSSAGQDDKLGVSPSTAIPAEAASTSRSSAEAVRPAVEYLGDAGDQQQLSVAESRKDGDGRRDADGSGAAERGPPSSRPGSSASSDRRQDGEPQDSPVTSIDEEQRARPPVGQKQTPSKVQGLVEMYDGLSKTSGPDFSATRTHDPRVGEGHEPPEGPSDQSSRHDTRELEEDSRKIQTHDVGGAPDQENAAAASSTPVPPADDGHSESEAQDGNPVRGSGDDGAQPDRRPTFSVDYQLLDQLFSLPPRTTGGEDATAVDAYVPDHVLVDSFTTIAERKTWYRISRQGPLRRHNVGDDDNYRRVVWAASTIREETMLVVRRWTEEDSFSGRPTLGGAGGKGNIFGWDSEAEPVALDVVFRKHRGSARPAAGAHSDGVPEPRRLRPLESTPKEEAGGSPQAKSPPRSVPVAQFGWSTGGMPPDWHPDPPRAPQQTGISWGFSPAPTAAGAAGVVVPPVGLVPPAGPVPAAAAAAAPVPPVSDNDDEWGEMVTSTPGTFDAQCEPLSIRNLDTLPSPTFRDDQINAGVRKEPGPPRTEPAAAALYPDADGMLRSNGETATLLVGSHGAEASPPARSGLFTKTLASGLGLASERSLLADSDHVVAPESHFAVPDGLIGERRTTSHLETPPSVPSRSSTASSPAVPSNPASTRHDKAAARVVDGLPDLAYMFR